MLLVLRALKGATVVADKRRAHGAGQTHGAATGVDLPALPANAVALASGHILQCLP